jgi:hypothetical protein
VLIDGESASFSIESISFNTTDDRFLILDATEITRAWQRAARARAVDWLRPLYWPEFIIDDFSCLFF